MLHCAEDKDPGGWSGWKEIEVELPPLPPEEQLPDSLADSDDDASESEGKASMYQRLSTSIPTLQYFQSAKAL